jgi:uncharacterized protein YifE (UPF0438 family)
MAESGSFLTDRQFNPRQYFPYGIGRSGEFTCEQAELLMNHGHAYQALADGSREPVTEEEARFVAACRNERPVETAHERAWSLFCAKISRPRLAVNSPLITAGANAVDLSADVIDVEL